MELPSWVKNYFADRPDYECFLHDFDSRSVSTFGRNQTLSSYFVGNWSTWGNYKQIPSRMNRDVKCHGCRFNMFIQLRSIHMLNYAHTQRLVKVPALALVMQLFASCPGLCLLGKVFSEHGDFEISVLPWNLPHIAAPTSFVFKLCARGQFQSWTMVLFHSVCVRRSQHAPWSCPSSRKTETVQDFIFPIFPGSQENIRLDFQYSLYCG